jgi:glutamine synthetase
VASSSDKDLLKTIYQHKSNLLKSVLADFYYLNVRPKIGVEIEFYLHNLQSDLIISGHQIQDFISKLKSVIKENNIDILDIDLEQGCSQIEIKTNPYFDLQLLCKEIVTIKKITTNLAQKFDYYADFSSQPYENDCGSSLQINFSLVNYQNNYLFSKEELESEYLLRSIAALLEFAHNIIIIFAPKKKDYLRFDTKINKNLFNNKKYGAPTNISWGYNNRTTLVRIPSSNNGKERRLEFRLGASDADIYLSVTFFLLVILEGFINNKKPAPPTYGNAFDEQYLLKTLPQNYQMAQYCFFTENKIIKMVKRILSKLKNSSFPNL